MTRVPEVIDVWFDSGAMPFAQWHAPMEHEDRFGARFPADFICEAIDQTRGWFYSLLAISTLLFDRSSYENVVCLGHIRDKDDKKMSKSLGNIVPPWDVLDRFGADAFRWYFFTAKQPWDGYRFDREAVGEGVRLFLRQLWNVHAFHDRYAAFGDQVDGRRDRARPLARVAAQRGRHGGDPRGSRRSTRRAPGASSPASSTSCPTGTCAARAAGSGTATPTALRTLRETLVVVSQLLAPFCPFIADELYEGVGGPDAAASVHLTDWPAPGARDEELEFAMAVAREAVGLGQAARSAAKVRVRQPLREAAVVAAGRERAALERLADVVRDELNVKALRFVERADELGSYEVKPNYRSLGPRFGKAMPQAAAAVGALDPAHVAEAVREGRTMGINVDGHEHELTAGDLLLRLQPLEGYQVERQASHAVALDLAVDAELRREGLVRDIVRTVQEARKQAGLEVEDRIALTLGGDDELLDAARAHEAYLAGEVLAVTVAFAPGPDGNDEGSSSRIEGRELHVAVVRAPVA
jgi:isoleucyl-tRNA synthetase